MTAVLRWTGIAAIALGTAWGLWDWERSMRERLWELKQLADFYRRAGQVLEKEQQPLIPFFRAYSRETAGRASPLGGSLELVAAELERNVCPEGIRAWKKVIESKRDGWALGKEQWNCFLESGADFFGRDRRRLSERLLERSRRMAEFEEEERRALLEKKKVLYPLGILGAAMLVIFFY